MEPKHVVPLAVAAVAGAGIALAAHALSQWLEWRSSAESVELRRSRNRVAELEARLAAEIQKERALEAAVAAANATAIVPAPVPKKRIRVYADGCYDLMHFGHANALRQARALGDELVVGLIGDADIIKNKGSPPVMPEEERYIALAACKFVDEVIRDAPYDLTQEWVDTLIRDHGIDYVVHGDDPCFTADGKDAYAYAKSIGRYRQFKRTEGVSTTDIVGRMLLMTREHHVPAPPLADRPPLGVVASATSGGAAAGGAAAAVSSAAAHRRRSSSSLRSSALAADRESDSSSPSSDSSPAGGASSSSASRALACLPAAASSRFLPTARRIMQFAEGRVPRPDERVVYICGGFDLFNAGHIAALQEARKFGDFLLVGVHDDATIHDVRGHGLPVLNLYERTLSLLSCKYVDEVIIGAPWEITAEMLSTMNISVVVKGSVSDMENAGGHEHLGWRWEGSERLSECYAVPRAKGILREIHSPRSLTALDVIERILLQRENFQRRYEKKSVSEAAYVRAKSYVEEQ